MIFPNTAFRQTRSRGGGPPKDGIPAILDPQFIPAQDATFLEDADEVIGFETALGRARTFSREGGAIRDGDGINIGERQRLHVNHFSKSDFTNGVSRVRL